MPNFILFGAAKAGTTSVYKYLEQHPDIFMSSFKEPGFFAFEGEKPILNGPGAQKWVDRWVVTDLKSYQQLFSEYNGQKAIGEASPYYIYYYQKTPQRIYHHVPNIKLIAMLRNPVERAFSNYVWAVRDRAESLTNFEDALGTEAARIADNWGPKWRYKDQGFYYQQLKAYYEIFNPEQIKICLYEDFVTNPIAIMQEIFAFLDIDSDFIPDMSERHNSSKIPRNKAWHQFLDKPNVIKSTVKHLLPLNFRQNLKQNAKEKNLFKPTLDSKIREHLRSEYREDILQLQDLIDRDLSLWL